MNIFLDEVISWGEQLFQPLGCVKSFSGRSLQQSVLVHTNALVVRSVTPVNKNLLQETDVEFVGSTTAGMDHIDTDWLKLAGIKLANAPGCNSVAVVEYVLSVLFLLAQRGPFSLQHKKIGIVGAGNIGRRLNERLQALGVHTILCDPPRAARGEYGPFFPFEYLVAQADLLTFHTPLQSDGPYPTWHLVNSDVIDLLRPNTILINSSRGAVIDNKALLTALEKGKKLTVVLDVWENEPQILLPLLDRVAIGTPHIAGHTLEAKINAIVAVYTAFCSYFNVQKHSKKIVQRNTPSLQTIEQISDFDVSKLFALSKRVYDVANDDLFLRSVACAPGGFDQLRIAHPNRRQWSSINVRCAPSKWHQLLSAIGFRVTHTTT